MAGKSKGPLDQRLKDLEKEVNRVRGDIKSLSRAVQDPDLGDLPLIQYGRSQAAEAAEAPARPVEPAAPREPALRKELASPVAPERPAPEAAPRPKRRPAPPPEKKPEREAPPDQVLTDSEGVIRSRVLSGGGDPGYGSVSRRTREAGSLSKDYRFASYLSSVSMSSPGPTRRERSVQRNKAVVMVVLVALALFVVVRLLT